MKVASRLQVEQVTDGPDRILRFRGTADMLSLPAVQDLFADLGNQTIRLLAVDLTETLFINSPVWAVITLHARRRPKTARVAVIGMPDRIKGSFELMGLGRELRAYATLAEAQADFDVPVA